jgi:uncharacterized protein YbjT (DUF2867 family)
MNHRSSTVLIIGATGSIGRHAVAEALRHGHTVRALVRDQARAADPARRRSRPVEAAQRAARPRQRQPVHDCAARLVRLERTRPA